MNTLIINSAKLQELTAFSKYVEVKYIEPYILTIQIQYIKIFLGDDFYSEILSQIKNNNLSLFNERLLYGTNDELFLGLQMYLAWLCYREYLLQANQKSTQTGVRVYNDNTSEVIDFKTQSTLIKDSQEKADFYKNETLNYLQKNKANYPLFEFECKKNTKDNSFVFGFGFGVVKK